MAPLIASVSARDIRFPTSRGAHLYMGAFWHHLTGDGQLRWLGPEKGIIHLATAALVNAVWDLWARVEAKPLWKRATRPERERAMRADGFPAYTTSTGWLGYPEDEVRRRSREAVQAGWRAAT